MYRFKKYNSLPVLRMIAFSSAMAVLLAASVTGQKRGVPVYEQDHLLAPRERVARKIEKDELHRYTVKLKRGELLHIQVVQRGVNIVLALLKGDSDRKILKQVDKAQKPSGTESLVYLPDADGNYLVGVFASGENSPGSSYILQNRAPFLTRAEKLDAAFQLDNAGMRASDNNHWQSAITYHRQAIGVLKGLPPTE